MQPKCFANNSACSLFGYNLNLYVLLIFLISLLFSFYGVSHQIPMQRYKLFFIYAMVSERLFTEIIINCSLWCASPLSLMLPKITSLCQSLSTEHHPCGKRCQNRTATTATLDKIADALGVPTWQLIASHKEVCTDIEEDKGGFASFIRYKGIHYTSDTLEEFFKQVEELKAIAR